MTAMTLVHPTSIKSLRSELMSSTALTPTYHKGGGGFASIIAVVAAIAIPFAAPAIAATLATSFGVTSAIGFAAISAGVGGVLGAATAAITGGNIGIGALGGAIGGGIGGYARGLPGTSVVDPGGALTAAEAAQGVGGAIGTGGGTASTGVGLTSILNPFGEGGVGTGFGADPGGFATGGDLDAFRAGASAPTTGDILTGGQQFASAGGGDVNLFGGTGTGTSNQPAFGMRGQSGLQLPATDPGGAASASQAAQIAAITQQAPVASPSLLDQATAGVGGLIDRGATAASEFLDDPWTKVGDAVFGEPGAQVLGKVATDKISQYFTDDPTLTPQQTEADDRRRQAEDEQRRLLGLRTAAAERFGAEAAAIDPERQGRENLAVAQGRLARTQEAGLRGFAPSQQAARAASVRRGALDRARLGGSAFSTGVDAATQRRLGLTAHAVGAFPSGAGVVTSAQQQAKDADARRESQRQEQVEEQKRIASLVDPLATSIFGLDSEDERKKRALEGA